MKILITGGSGFIGRNLTEQYGGLFCVAAPSRAELDLLDAEAVCQYLKRNHFDVVIHAATDRSNRRLAASADLLERNCRMFFNLVRNESSFGRMLFLSSGAVYGRPQAFQVAEGAFDTCVPTDPYGFSKYLCARVIPSLARTYELRLFAVFGPHEDWQVRFISNACCRALWGLPVALRQNLFFDYLDVQDLGWMLEALIARELRHRQYNLCTGRPIDLLTLARKVVAVSGKDVPITVQNGGLGPGYSGNNSRLMEEIPDFHFREIDDSIAHLYSWYAARKESIDPSLLHFDERVGG